MPDCFYKFILSYLAALLALYQLSNMKQKPFSIIFVITCLVCMVFFYACTKDSGGNKTIQQGNTTIEILPIYTSATPAHLIIKYNNVIDAPIYVTVTFHLKNSETHDVTANIPGGHKQLESWGSDGYLNVWDYSNPYDSTSGGQPPARIDGSWDVDYVTITAVSCPDKNYGFKVLVPDDSWTYYQPKDPVTSVSFVVNQDTISFSDYDFDASASQYLIPTSTYGFYFYKIFLQMFSEPSAYPLQKGQAIDIPYFHYYWDNRNHGSQLSTAEQATNGSTLVLTITSITDKHFNADFSGKIWSSLQPDTLFISGGKIENTLLPIKTN